MKKPKSTETERLLHKLQVHQVELESQNTELRTARDALEVALANYTEVYDFAPAGYITLAEDGTITLLNLTGATLLGSERSRLIGKLFRGLVSREQRSRFSAFLKQVFASKTKQTEDFKLESKLVVRVRAQRSASGKDCSVVIVNVTERVQAEAAHRASEIRYRRLFETAHDGVLLLDPATRKITDANPFMTDLLGYSHTQFVGKELFEIGLLNDKVASQEMFRILKRKHEARYEDLPLMSKGGKTHQVEVVANLYEEDGNAVIQCNIRDITARKLVEHAQHRVEILAASNTKLEKEIDHRKAAESLLKTSKDQLRHLARKLITAQEEERRRISRELHDVIAQTLTGINVRLASLKAESSSIIPDFLAKIAHTQEMVEQSVGIVHRFARELRPSMLDDLGLVPALKSYMKTFIADTGIVVTLTAFDDVERMEVEQRTVLYRIVQEALTNVFRHAKATAVEISIRSEKSIIIMEITDNGVGFEVSAKKSTRLGLLGMGERVEMIGGVFHIASTVGKYTTVRVEIPATIGETIQS
jgi:PAS domain S-box-containing protein